MLTIAEITTMLYNDTHEGEYHPILTVFASGQGYVMNDADHNLKRRFADLSSISNAIERLRRDFYGEAENEAPLIEREEVMHLKVIQAKMRDMRQGDFEPEMLLHSDLAGSGRVFNARNTEQHVSFYTDEDIVMALNKLEKQHSDAQEVEWVVTITADVKKEVVVLANSDHQAAERAKRMGLIDSRWSNWTMGVVRK